MKKQLSEDEINKELAKPLTPKEKLQGYGCGLLLVLLMTVGIFWLLGSKEDNRPAPSPEYVAAEKVAIDYFMYQPGVRNVVVNQGYKEAPGKYYFYLRIYYDGSKAINAEILVKKLNDEYKPREVKMLGKTHFLD